MNINIHGSKIDITPAIKDYILEKIGRLEKYFDANAQVKVNCINQAKQDQLEITINCKGMFFRSEVLSDNMYNNIDLALPKIEKQIVKQGSKLKSKFKKDAFIGADFMFLEEKPEPETSKLVKRKKFELDPLTVEDAEMYMEALDHNFYIFLNAETGKVNVVYKRNDRNYGLIEVEY